MVIKDEEQLLETIYSYRKAQLIFIAVKLRISDILSRGPRSSDEIAKITNTHHDALYRVLRALAGIGIYKHSKPKYFELTPLGELLREDNKSSVRINALMRLDEYNWKPWGELLYSVQTGKSAFEKIFGKNIFEYFSGHPDEMKVFNNALKTYTESWVESLLSTYDFSPYKRIADIGGGHGMLIQSILEKYPRKTGLLFDLPNVIAGIREEFINNKISDRCDLIEGDFFTSIPSGCDVYILKKIIHDWDDKHAVRILSNCYKALHHNSRILLLENVIMEDDSDSPQVFLNDIHMMVQTIGGRERTKEEYTILLTKAGFKPLAMTHDFVEGIK